MGLNVRIEVGASPEASIAEQALEGAVLLVNELMHGEARLPQKALPTYCAAERQLPCVTEQMNIQAVLSDELLIALRARKGLLSCMR